MSTYEPIATQTLGSAAASVTFSSIPQGYTDLVLSLWVKSPVTNGDMAMQFNFDTGSNYSNTQVYGDGSGAYSNRGTNQTYARVGNNLQTNEGLTVVHIQNYSNSITFKTILSRSGSAQSGGVVAFVNLWRNTNPITSLVITPGAGGNWGAGSTFSIYGIQVGQTAQKAQGGNIVTTDGTYVYHTFTSSGAFIPSQALTADYLVVAGGGGGGSAEYGGGGGGGAGGYRSFTSQSLSAKSYPVIIGAGGAGSLAITNKGSSGSNSVFGTDTSAGGGGGGSEGTAAGAAGGSGGGVRGGFGGGTGGAGNTPSTSPVQGYRGGNEVLTTNGGMGGGGSAGIGTDSFSGNQSGTTGGPATTSSISGSSVEYAGGGGGADYSGGGSGRAGGGGGAGAGGGSTTRPGGDATPANRGSGGGGGSGVSGVFARGGSGSSGVVIIRYAI